MLTIRQGRCTLRTRLWLWLFTLVFAGFVLHATVCACEVAHPHKGSTKPCVVQCHTNATERSHATAHRSARPDILHPALLLLFTPQRALHTISSRFVRFTPENSDPLLARGPPPVSALFITSGAR